MGDSESMKNGNTSRLVLAIDRYLRASLGPAATASAKKKPSFPKPFAITKSGPVLGMTVNGVNEYLGIPYAKPPVGALRWMPPKAFGKFAMPLEANQFGSECTQPGPSGSEDCLFLNVYTPAQTRMPTRQNPATIASADAARKKALPVMVWIHGGGLTAGGGDLYDPTPLVNGGGVIVVTINYRLGVLGFLAQTGLDAEAHESGQLWVHGSAIRAQVG